MATTKRQRRFNGMANVVAAHRRNNKPAAPAAPAAPVAPVVPEQPEVITVDLDASPVNGASAEPAAPAEAPEVPAAPAAPAKPDAEPAEPAAPTGFTIEQEVALIAAGLKTLLGVEQGIPTTPEDLLLLGLRTARQTVMAVIADEESLKAIHAKRDELMNKVKALVPPAPGKKERQQEPEAEPVEVAQSWAVRMR